MNKITSFFNGSLPRTSTLTEGVAIKLFLVFLGSCFLVTGAQAVVISVDWNFESEVSGHHLTATDVAGVVPVDNWNVFTTNASQTNLINDSGAATTAEFTTSLSGPTQVGSPLTSSNDNKMMYDVLYDNSANVDPAAFITYLSISQVPYASFDLYIYTSVGVTDRTATFQIGSDQEVKGAGSPSTFVQGANYVLFSGLTASSFTVDARANSDTSAPQVVFNGFQIVDTAPEPASFGLLAAGGAVLLGRRRRNRC